MGQKATEVAETATNDAENEEEDVKEEAGENPLRHRNVIDAAAAGASDGLHLALNAGAIWSPSSRSSRS